ncbi:MAG: TIGR02186 family protein [Dongiaceae bacterium]
MAGPGRKLLAIGIAVVAVLLGAQQPARGQALIADLSDHLIAINTGFTGVDLLLFGTIDQPGDIVVVVNGPTTSIEVRRKQRIAGIWINADRVSYVDVPSFYAVASSRPLDELAAPALREELQIGVEHLAVTPRDDAHADESTEFRAALVRNMQKLGLYDSDPGQVTFLGNQLFRTTVTFPSNVPTGSYRVQVLLIRDGEVAGAQTTPLVVGKIGFDADVFQFAHVYSAIYGLLAIVGALLAGGTAHLVFRRL